MAVSQVKVWALNQSGPAGKGFPAGFAPSFLGCPLLLSDDLHNDYPGRKS